MTFSPKPDLALLLFVSSITTPATSVRRGPSGCKPGGLGLIRLDVRNSSL